MNKGVLYYKAHKIANIFEHDAIKHIRGKNKNLGGMDFFIISKFKTVFIFNLIY